jgi:CRP-like cAMP-binding protein
MLLLSQNMHYPTGVFMSDLLIHAFQTHPMFNDISLTSCQTLMNCLGCREKSYKKDQIIPASENSARQIGIVISGCVHTIKEDIWGRCTFLTYTGDDGVIGEVLIEENLSERGIIFKAAEPTTVLFIPADRILHPCRNSCPFHHQLSRNLFHMISNKNAALTEKIEITSKSSLREKVLAYLSIESRRNGSTSFTIPLGRAEMADYLCTNRSALSRELARMKQDGIIEYEGRAFRILNAQM